MPWACFEIQFAKEQTFETSIDFQESSVGKRSRKIKANQVQEAIDTRMRAGLTREEAEEEVIGHPLEEDEYVDHDYYTSRGSLIARDEGRTKRCGKSSWKICVCHTHTQ